MSITHLMVSKAARALVDRHAAACNVHPDDVWAYESEPFFEDALAALEAALGEDFVMVPRVPTQGMLDAGYWPCTQGRGAKSVWSVMVMAATIPSPPEVESNP